MANLLPRLVLSLGVCTLLAGCVAFPAPNDPAARYEANTDAAQSYDRIHDNMNVATYNHGAGALARGDKKRLDQSLAQLDASGGQFNGANAGNLRALASCVSPTGQNDTTSSQCPRR